MGSDKEIQEELMEDKGNFSKVCTYKLGVFLGVDGPLPGSGGIGRREVAHGDRGREHFHKGKLMSCSAFR